MHSPPPRSGRDGKPWEPCGIPYTWDALDAAVPSAIAGTDSLNICSLALGKGLTMMLSDDGSVYATGSNAFGQLGREVLPEGHEASMAPLRIDIGKAAKSIECGHDHCAAISVDGELFMWGRADGGQCAVPPDRKAVTAPTRVQLGDGRTVKAVSCGVSHTLAIDDTGACWSWGQGFQLGHGEDRSISHMPRQIEGLRNHWVIRVAAGGRHSLALAVKRSVIASPDAVWLASIDYQIWSWGENECGQLGVGDQVARAVPIEVSKLQALRCVDIAAGGEHSIVRTCLGHIYTWGAEEGADGRVVRDRVSPVRLPSFDGKGIVCVAASSGASVLLGSSGAGDLSVVYLLGGGPSADQLRARAGTPHGLMSPGGVDADGASSGAPSPASVASSGTMSPVSTAGGPAAAAPAVTNARASPSTMVGIPTALTNIAHIGFVRVIVAGGDTCGLLAHDKGVSAAIAMVLRELASSEISFVNALRNSLRSWLLPFAKAVRADPGQHFPVPSTKDAFDVLLATYSETWHLACTSATQFSEASGRGHYGNVFEVFNRLDSLQLYRQYTNVLCDAVAIGVFIDHPKLSRSALATSDFRTMMQLPIERIEIYASVLNRLMALLVADTENCKLATAIASDWDKLRKSSDQMLSRAAETEAFWRQNSSLRKTFGTASRRVVLHSKACHLHLNKVLSASTWYILCEDALLVPQVFSHREYPLHTLWVEDVPDTEVLQHGIRITSTYGTTGTTVESFVVYAEKASDKAQWLDAFTRCIGHYVVSFDDESNIARLASGAVARADSNDTFQHSMTLSQLEKRFVCFRVQGHPEFKDAVFEGETVLGRVTGRGHFLCDDGRVYKGHFQDGLCHGFCEMTAPDGVGAHRLVKGPWRRGKLHGIAFVSSYDGSTFCGSYINGIREGHGTWVSDVDDRYVGGWKQNLRHGYGVHETEGGSSRYLGIWTTNERCGRGVVIKEGLYYEGDFVGNKLSGKGILVTADDYIYEGDFSSDCHMHGKGKLTMPNGDHVEGVFKGRWQDRNGIQVSGTYFQHQNLGAGDSGARCKGHGPLTTHLRKPCVPVELKWSSAFYGCVLEFTAEQPPTLEADLPPDAVGPRLVEFFKQTGHPLNRLVISLISAMKAAYGSRTVTHHRLLSDLIVEIQHLTGRLDALIRQFYAEHHAAHAAEFGDNALYEFLLQTIMLDELYPEVLANLYQSTFTSEEGTYAHGLSRLNMESDVELLERFGAPRHFWLMSPARETQLRHSLTTPLRNTPTESPLRALGGTMESTFAALSPTPGATPSTSPRSMVGLARNGVAAAAAPAPESVPELLDAWSGKSVGLTSGLSPMTVALESRPGDLASLRAALTTAPLHKAMKSDPSLLTPRSSQDGNLANVEAEARPYATAIACMKTLPAQRRPAEKLEVLSAVFTHMNEEVDAHSSGAFKLGGMDDVLPIFLFVLVRAAVPHLRSELQYLFDFTDFERIAGEKEIMLTTLRAGFFQLLKETKKGVPLLP